MLTDTVLDSWHNLRSRQLDWAFHAYDRLLKTLSVDVQERLQLKGDVVEPYVVVFGKTQVGKTTLLLDLMGIDSGQMATISQVLRGGREAGKSATATAMEYCRSETDRWGLSIRSKTTWFESDQEITHALGQLREEMERGCLIVDSPCEVHIPSRFFSEGSSATPNVRILDLPGDCPALEAEQNYVIQMAKAFLPFADLILLVGRGDDLGFLRSGEITLPGIEDWQSMSYRFRVVTTYSYSAKSLKDFLKGNEDVDSARIRERLVQQIEHFGSLNETAKDKNLYFPLEFGTSWMTVKDKEPNLYARMAPIISELRRELLEQIVNATTPIARLRNTLNAHLSVKYIQAKKEEVINEKIFKLEKQSGVVRGEVNDYRRIITKNQKKILEIVGALERNSIQFGMDLLNKEAELNFHSLGEYPPAESGQKHCEALLGLMSRYYRLLEGMRLNVKITEKNAAYLAKVRRHFIELDSFIIKGVLDSEFSKIRSKLNSYWFDNYIMNSNYIADLKDVNDAGEKSKAKLIQLWKAAWIKAINEVENNLKLDFKKTRLEVEGYEKEENILIQKLINFEQEICIERADLEQVRRAGEEDLARCKEFVCLLDEEYLEEITNRIDIALQRDDDCDALLEMFSCVGLMYQREDFIKLHEMGD